MKKYTLYLSVLLAVFLVGCSSSDTKKEKTPVTVKDTTAKSTETVSSEKTENIKIVGVTDLKEGELVTLEQAVGNSKTTIESLRLDNKGGFEFTKGIQKYGFYRVNLKDSAYAYVVADEENIRVNFDITNKKVEVLDSPESTLYVKFLNLVRSFHTQVQQVQAESIDLNAKRNKILLLQSQYHENSKKFILENSPSCVALNASKEFAQNAYEHKEFFEKILEFYEGKIYAADFLPIIEQNLNKVPIQAGYIAPDFELNTLDGNTMKLSDLRGQYVMIDFWASWCGPCRRENPNVVRMYKKYHEKGFEILGVSLDRNQGSWQAAVEKDNLTWKHVSDLKQWNSVVVPLYNVTGIPKTVLLDKEGKIIATDLRGASLEAKLAELFD